MASSLRASRSAPRSLVRAVLVIALCGAWVGSAPALQLVRSFASPAVGQPSLVNSYGVPTGTLRSVGHAYDMDGDGRGEVMTSGDFGSFTVQSAAGQTLFQLGPVPAGIMPTLCAPPCESAYLQFVGFADLDLAIGKEVVTAYEQAFVPGDSLHCDRFGIAVFAATSQTVQTIPNATALAIEDMTGDGKDDLLVQRWTEPYPPAFGQCYFVAGPVELWSTSPPTTPASVDPGAGAPRQQAVSLRLAPNPARGPVTMWVTLSEAGPWSARVLDLAGRRVRALAAPGTAAGEHVLLWDGRGEDGRQVPPGTYYVEAAIEGQRGVRKLVVLQ